jgi:hypothetical protein
LNFDSNTHFLKISRSVVVSTQIPLSVSRVFSSARSIPEYSNQYLFDFNFLRTICSIQQRNTFGRFLCRPQPEGSSLQNPHTTSHEETMGQPLHSSFTLRPSSAKGQDLTFRSPSADMSSNWQTAWTRKRVITFESGGEQRKRIRLPSDFEPPSDEDYWKKRCFHMQDVCQQTRKRTRDMEEDQRQLRRRIWELEESLLQSQSPDHTHDLEVDSKASKVPVSEASTTADQPPVLVINVPTNKDQNCCFYLTDGEGLSDWEDDGYDSDDDDRDEDDCSRSQ